MSVSLELPTCYHVMTFFRSRQRRHKHSSPSYGKKYSSGRHSEAHRSDSPFSSSSRRRAHSRSQSLSPPPSKLFGSAAAKPINRSTVKYATSLAAELNKKKARERLDARNRLIKQNNTIDLTQGIEPSPPSPVSTETPPTPQVRTVVKEEHGAEVIASNRTSGPGTTLGENIVVTVQVDNPTVQVAPQQWPVAQPSPVAVQQREWAGSQPSPVAVQKREWTPTQPSPVAVHPPKMVPSPVSVSHATYHRPETMSLAKRATMMSRLPLPPMGPEEETESDGVSSPYRYSDLNCGILTFIVCAIVFLLLLLVPADHSFQIAQ